MYKQIDSRFTPATDLKIGTFVLIPNFTTQKGISKKFTTTPKKRPYQIIDKPTDVTYKLTDLKKKKLFSIEINYYPITQKNTHSVKILN